MKFNICFLSILILSNSNANIESAHIINDTDQSLRVNFGVPEYSRADILITKINDLQSALHKAILSDSVIEVRNAVRAGADVNMPQDGKRPLLVAIILSRHNAIETLLKLGAKSDNSCGEYVTKMKDPKSLLLLMRHGQFNFNIKELVGIISSISLCSGQNNRQFAIDLITESINHGYDINEFWGSVISLALHSRTFEAEEMVRFMLFRGANPNHIITRNGDRDWVETPLLFAAVYFTNKKIVQILVEAGANINQKVKFGSRRSPISVLSYLIEASGKPNAEKKEVIEFLLENGASL